MQGLKNSARSLLPKPLKDALRPWYWRLTLGNDTQIQWRFHGHPDQPFGATTYAQFGEDMIILNAFALRGIAKPSYLDIGAHHPVNCSNTALLYARGSRGVCVEANPNLVPAFAQMRPHDLTLCLGAGPARDELEFFMIDDYSGRNSFHRATAEAFVQAHPQFKIREIRKIPVLPLDDIVQLHCGGIWPDFLSLDAEGLDHAILAASAFSAQNGPKLICVETVSGDDASREDDIATLLRARGYAPEGRTVANVIWGAA